MTRSWPAFHTLLLERFPWLFGSVIAVVLLTAATSAPTTFNPTTQRVTSMYCNFDYNRVRLVVELQGNGKPIYQVYYRPQDNTVVLDLRNVDAAAAQVPALGPDNLVTSWELQRPNFLSATWGVRLGYGLPAGHIHSMLLENPTRLVVDIERAYSEQMSLQVTGNIRWGRHEVRTADDFYLINELEIDHRKSGVSLNLAMAGDPANKVERPTELAARHNALALINGGFFSAAAGPLGLIVEAGKIVRPQVATRPPRTALGLTAAGNVLMSRVEVRDNVLHSLDKQDWSKVALALGGGPRLVRDGHIDLTVDEEALGKSGNDITRKAARTAVALLKNGHLLLVAVTGYRDNHHEGWVLPQLAAWLLNRGAQDAMCLDGGGSTAMVLQSQLISHTAANHIERKVADAFMVNDQAPLLLPSRMEVVASRHLVPADGVTSVKVVAEVRTADGKRVGDGVPVYFSAVNGTITPSALTQGGHAVALWSPLRNPGISQIAAFAGLCWGEDKVIVEAGAPRYLEARVPQPAASQSADTTAPSPSPTASMSPSPSRVVMVEALVTDAFRNPLANQEVRVEAAGSKESATTGVDGVAHIRIALAADIHTVRVFQGSLQPLDVTVN